MIWRTVRFVVALGPALLVLGACSPDGPVGPSEDDTPPPEATFSTLPRVDGAGPTAAVVSWVPSIPVPQTVVHWGIAGEALSQRMEVHRQDSLHEAVVLGLLPSTSYRLVVSQHNPGDGQVGRSDTLTFRTREPLPDIGEIEPFQREVLARLTGALPIRDTLRLRSRSDTLERRLSAEFIADQLASAGLQPEVHEFPMGRSVARNVFARIEATEPSTDWVLVGAHYDSVWGSPGAVDNASGTVAVLTLATHLQRVPRRRHNVMIVLFDVEEAGLWGSAKFRDYLNSTGVNVRSMHNYDMLGWDGDGDGAVNLSGRDSFPGYRPSREIVTVYRLAVHRSLPPPQLYVYDRRGTSDHILFPGGVMLSEELWSDTTPYYHSAGDVYETVNFRYLRTATQIALDALTLLLSD